jgi:hypothetical protein
MLLRTRSDAPDASVLPSVIEDTGRKLREKFVERATRPQPCDCYICQRRKPNQRELRYQRENYWIAVVCNAMRGDPSYLVKHLRSRRALTQFDRKMLAECLEAHLTGEVGKDRGRPQKHYARLLARMALIFYQEWKQINRRQGIRDHGHGGEMKDEACRVALDFYDAGLLQLHPTVQDIPTFDCVRELMDRPKSRR